MISAHPAAVLAKRNIHFFFHQFQLKNKNSNIKPIQINWKSIFCNHYQNKRNVLKLVVMTTKVKSIPTMWILIVHVELFTKKLQKVVVKELFWLEIQTSSICWALNSLSILICSCLWSFSCSFNSLNCSCCFFFSSAVDDKKIAKHKKYFKQNRQS